MKRISYVGRKFLTGDHIADAIVDYATALARRGRADRVDIPVLVQGRSIQVEFVLGPASQFVVEPVGESRDEPVDDKLVDDLNHRAALLRDPRPIVVAGDPRSSVDGWDLPDDLLD